jgi:hypothetical protein
MDRSPAARPPSTHPGGGSGAAAFRRVPLDVRDLTTRSPPAGSGAGLVVFRVLRSRAMTHSLLRLEDHSWDPSLSIAVSAVAPAGLDPEGGAR